VDRIKSESGRIGLDDKYQDIIMIEGLDVDTGFPVFHFRVAWEDVEWLRDELGKALDRRRARLER
jgi:hypothetical protein